MQVLLDDDRCDVKAGTVGQAVGGGARIAGRRPEDAE